MTPQNNFARDFIALFEKPKPKLPTYEQEQQAIRDNMQRLRRERLEREAAESKAA